MGALTETSDPSGGFSGLVSVFELEGDVFRTRPNAVYATFNHQSFLAQKPARGLRIFTLGGSSSYGFLWNADVAFTAVLGDVLATAHPDRHVEAVNVSGISYAIHRLAIVADEIVGYEPDILIIYSGHNEFIERSFFDQLKSRSYWQNQLERFLLHSRLYSFLREFLTAHDPSGRGRFQMFVRRESDVYTERRKRKIVDEYERGLRGIVHLAHERGAKVMIATLPANLRQWRPQESILPGTMESEQLASWSKAFRAGKEKLASGQYKLAERDLQIALELAPTYCETLYWLGQTHEGLQQWTRARKAYQQACDCDASPARRLSAINRAAVDVAESEGALLVDLDQVFQQESPHGLVGFELIEDYVHPTLEGHQIIAWSLWQAMERSGWLGQEADAQRDLRSLRPPALLLCGALE